MVQWTFVSYWRAPQYTIGKFTLLIFTALFNRFTFYKLKHTSIDMQFRFFSIFLTLTICPLLIQQTSPWVPLFPQSLPSTRECEQHIPLEHLRHWCHPARNSLPYCSGDIVRFSVVVPRRLPHGLAQDRVFLFSNVSVQYVYVSFGQAIAAFAPNELLTSLIVPIFFLFVIAFCGAIIPYAGIPMLWRFVYWVSPSKYLVSGFVGC